MNDSTPRETLSSGLGFLLISAGCAVGLGNVWRFPYIVGENGGALFVLLYVFFLAIFGLPMMVAEFAVGRAAQRSLAVAYSELCPKAKIYRKIGMMQQAGNWLLMMFYTTVAGWMLAYPFYIASRRFDFSEPKEFFEAFTSSPAEQVVWMTAVCAVGFFVCGIGLQKGVERVTKFMMSALLVLLVGLCVYILTLPGAGEGVSFYLKPNFAILHERPFFRIAMDALGQSFFTLSIGIGSMAIFGSYTSRRRRLADSALQIIVLDTLVALLAGLIIFPACAACGVKPDSGPSLLFITLPRVFAQMPAGTFIGAAFFVFLGMAALTTVIAVFENILAMTMDARKCSRRKAILRNAPLLWLLSLPCALGFNLLRKIRPLGEGSTILDLEDFLVSDIVLPAGALAILVFCVSSRFWGWKNFTDEANSGAGLALPQRARAYMTYFLPVLLVAIFGYLLFGALKNLFP